MDEDGATMRSFAAKAGRLRVRSSDEAGGWELEQVGPDEFVVPPGGHYMFFPAKGKEPSRVVRKADDGPTMTLFRVDPPGKLDEGALREYTGRYVSEELFRDQEVAVVSGGLSIRTFGSFDEWTRPKPVAKDRFAMNDITLSFERDARGKVSGLVVSSSRTRGVRLTKSQVAATKSGSRAAGKPG